MDDPSPAAHFPAVQPHPSALTDCTSHEHGPSPAWSNNNPAARHLLLQTTAAQRALSAPRTHRGHLPHQQSHNSNARVHWRCYNTAARCGRCLRAGGWVPLLPGHSSVHLPPPAEAALLPTGTRHRPPGHGTSPTPSHRPALTHSASVRPRGTRLGVRAMPAALGSRRTPGEQNETGEPLHHLPLPPWAPASSGGCCGTAPRWAVLGRGLGGCFLIYGIGAKSKRWKRRRK